MNFAQSKSYLFSLGNEVTAMKLGLAATEKLLAALGNPQNNFLKIQIAGTNGKGSTCAFLDRICRRAKIKTGLFTSPHLISVTERIKIGGAEISEENFARHASKIREIGENLVGAGELETVPTFFEQILGITISAFAEAEIELAILETGLGGRFDAVTATRAEIAAITPIDYDHQQILGDTLAEIAAEKAAIIRENMPVVIAPQKSEASAVILARCREKNVAPIIADCEIFVENTPEISLKTSRHLYQNINLSLRGAHQRQNACVAVNLAEILRADFKFSISDANIAKGLETARHKGRLEFYDGILFDGAHNVSGAIALSDYLKEFHANAHLTMIFAAMNDKDLREIAAVLFPLAESLILTKADNPRSAAPEELKKYAAKFIDEARIFSVPSVADALDAARQMTANYPATKESFVCVTGSLYLVGEAQKFLRSGVLES